MMDSDIIDMVNEAKEKVILHWNYRGLKEIPEAVRDVGYQVQEIYLKFNDLRILPFWISEFSNVTNLYLHGNCIEDLPDSLGYMTKLTVLDISNNKLKELPFSIGYLRNLQSLLLNNNFIKSLPPSMSELENLQHLYLSSNQIVALPEWIGSLPSLEELFVDNNLLEEIPNRLTLSKSLTLISVCSNNLSYLPLNGFVSSPYIRFDSNPYLNYLSLPVFYHLLSKVQSPHGQESVNAIAHGCFRSKSKDRYNVGTKLLLKHENSYSGDNEDIVIELPRQLLIIHTLHENEVVSLWESSVRKIYLSRFLHILDTSSNPPEINVSHEIQSINKAIYDVEEYPKSLIVYDLILNGPVSICLNKLCNEPIFTEAWVLIGIRKVAFTIPIIVILCSHRCAADFVKFTDFLQSHEMHGMHKFTRLN